MVDNLKEGVSKLLHFDTPSFGRQSRRVWFFKAAEFGFQSSRVWSAFELLKHRLKALLGLLDEVNAALEEPVEGFAFQHAVLEQCQIDKLVDDVVLGTEAAQH